VSFRLLFRREASLDIEDAVFWYEDQRPGLGERVTAELNRLLKRIAEAPLQFPEIEQGVRRGLMHRFPYSVYFLPEAEDIIVLAIVHQRRDPDLWKKRLGSEPLQNE
jgi:plasmid stabilization system protein ParE